MLEETGSSAPVSSGTATATGCEGEGAGEGEGDTSIGAAMEPSMLPKPPRRAKPKLRPASALTGRATAPTAPAPFFECFACCVLCALASSGAAATGLPAFDPVAAARVTATD
eukprot:1612021-Pleurochrysis_carterae.AAC.5